MSQNEPALPPGLELAWGVAAPGRRGPKPVHSIEELVEAAIGLADTYGLAALSLPKLAARIGLSTNALYRYIGSKDELLVLVRDAAWGTPPDAIRRAPDWRTAATEWTHAVVERYRARPWLLDLPVPGAPMTPGLLRWLETLLAAFGDTGLSDEDRLRSALLLDGHAFYVGSFLRKLDESASQPAQSAAAMEFLRPRLQREFPVLAQMLATGAYANEDGRPDGVAEFGLERILDGIELLIRRAKLT